MQGNKLSITITPVHSKRDLAEFVALPLSLHRRDKAFVPPLISEVKHALDSTKNPFFKHAEMEMFLARVEGKVVGRIAAVLDQNYLDASQQLVGLFGFFECINDLDVAHALFNTVSQWHRHTGMRKILGPTNPSMNDEIGVLTDAFDQPPVIKMVWNPAYYPALYENSVFTKAKDVFAYTMAKEDVSERLLKLGEILVKRAKVTFRHPNMKKFDREIEIFRGVYNQAWSQNWGFVSWTEAEFRHVAKGLKQVIDPDLVLIAEDNGVPVGFSLALPDLNIALRRINGRLFPFGLPLLLWHSRKIHWARVVTLGVIKEYRHRGIDTALYYETFRIATGKGYNGAEMSWILEDNVPMNRALEMMGAKRYKTYRLFERDL